MQLVQAQCKNGVFPLGLSGIIICYIHLSEPDQIICPLKIRQCCLGAAKNVKHVSYCYLAQRSLICHQSQLKTETSVFGQQPLWAHQVGGMPERP